MMRLHDWPQQLHGYIRATAKIPFAFRSQDCATWTLGAIDAMCGTGLRAEFIATPYDDEAGAARTLEARGWVTLQDAAREVLGTHEISPFKAQRGDVIWVPKMPDLHGRGPGGGLGILDVNAFVCPGTDRLMMLPFFPMVKRGAVVFPMGRRP